MSSIAREPSTLFVPLHSGLILQLEIDYALETVANTGAAAKLAILLHPWSRLGGSMDDPTLHALVKPLQHRGYHVIRYNARGVGQSSGKPSWTGLTEVEDLKELVHWGLKNYPECANTTVLLLGYSHGSLISTMHPVLPGPVKTAHIVLAYPLSPRPALTLFHGGTYASGLTALLADARADVLVVYGTADEFTAADKYAGWADGLRAGAAAKLELACVEDATHFWRGEARRRLHEIVCAWLDRPADA